MAFLHNSPATRVAVIGVGSMGRNHARIYQSLDNVDLVGVVDTDPARAREVADAIGCQPFTDVEDLIGRIDAASITVPSQRHCETGEFLLRNNVHCLIEKPLATTEDDCLRLIAAASDAGLVLAAGHVERFNPAVHQLKVLMANGVRVFTLDSRRLSLALSRNNDVDVILDLMIHDIDIVCDLVARPVEKIAAYGMTTEPGRGPDHVTALLTFGNGTIASITASRISHNKVRDMNVISEMGLFHTNYITQELFLYKQQEQDSTQPTNLRLGNYRLDLTIERIFVRPEEPLFREIRNFLGTINGTDAVLVDGRQALSSLTTALRVQDEVRKNLECVQDDK